MTQTSRHAAGEAIAAVCVPVAATLRAPAEQLFPSRSPDLRRPLGHRGDGLRGAGAGAGGVGCLGEPQKLLPLIMVPYQHQNPVHSSY